MEKVTLNSLSKDSFFHFTHINNINDISINGLKSTIGENASGIENTPKVFFSIGETGIIEIMEVWLRIIMNKIYGSEDILNLPIYNSTEDKDNYFLLWIKEFISKKYLDDCQKKEILYEYFYDYLKERVYLVLDIEEGKEFINNDYDEYKLQLSKNKNSIDYLLAKEQYGPFSNFNSTKMDSWNMHTKTNIPIQSTKIKQVITSDGKEDVLSILLEVYNKNDNVLQFKFLLNDFIKHVQQKELIEEGREDDQIDNCRLYKRKIFTRSNSRI